MKYLYVHNTRPNTEDAIYPVDGVLTIRKNRDGQSILYIGEKPVFEVDHELEKVLISEIALSFLQRDVHHITLVRNFAEKREMQEKLGG